jgi:hypothetical protein
MPSSTREPGKDRKTFGIDWRNGPDGELWWSYVDGLVDGLLRRLPPDALVTAVDGHS